ncbi:MAG: M90 family metallopeptidase [Pseudomonadota bacterium]
MPILISILSLIAGLFGFRQWSKQKHRKELLSSALTDDQRAIIDADVPLLHNLPADLRRKLEGKMALFLDQVTFYGNGGLEVTEEMKVSIAAQACLLIVNNDLWYDNLRTILIYPNAFKSKQARQSGFVVTEKEIVRTGESWNRGPVVLSWAHSKAGALDDHDGHNVVLHEFAHQIDDLSGQANGVPLLGKDQSFAEWEHVFVKAYKDHVHAVETGHRTLIDPYGAETHAEFFAVSVEVFFERPHEMKRQAPEVYGQLAKLFRLEPAAWH